MPIICDWYHHDCLLSCCSIFKVLCVSFTEVNSFIISHCFQLVKHFFQSFLISFRNRSFNRNRLFLAYLWAFWALVCRCLADSSYIISCPNWFVNTFFEKIRIFFKKVGNPHFFPYLCGFSSFSGTLRFWVFLSKSKIALCLQLFSLLFLILYAIMNELFLLCARSSVG